MFVSVRLYEMFSEDTISSTLVCSFLPFTQVTKIHLCGSPFLRWYLDLHHVAEGTY